MPTRHWPDNRVNMLRRMLRQGMTDQQIADALGITRKAVLGKRYRLKLPVNPAPVGRREAAPDLPLYAPA